MNILQFLRTWPLIPSGPGPLLGLTLFNNLKIVFVDTTKSVRKSFEKSFGISYLLLSENLSQKKILKISHLSRVSDLYLPL